MKLYYKIIDEEPVYSYCKIVEVESADGKTHLTIINPTEEQILEAGWIEYVATPEVQLQTAKENKIKEIEQYDSSDNVNQFTINGVSMWLDHNMRQQLKTSVEAYAAAGIESVTKIFGGIEYTFTPEQWLQMLVLLEVYASEAFNTTERHKMAVNNLETIEDVEAYDYTTGYPTKLEF